MKKVMQKVLIFFMTTFFVATTVGIMSAAADEKTGLTRAEWIHTVISQFNMTVDDDNYPDNYFLDLDEESDYYRDFMIAVEFGMIDYEAGENIYPEAPATREFASHTLNFCLGFQLEEDREYSFVDVYDCEYPDDDQIAVDRGWFALSGDAFLPNQEMTESEASAMIEDAENVQRSTEITADYENTYSFAKEVVVVSQDASVDFHTDDTVIIKGESTEVKQGDTFVVFSSDLPVLMKAESVKKTENGTEIAASKIEGEDDYIEEIDSQGSTELDLSLFEPEEGVDMEVNGFYEGGSSSSPVLRSLNVDTQAKSIILSKDINLGDGVSTNITCELSGLTLEHKINTNAKEFYIALKGDSSVVNTVDIDALSANNIDHTIVLGSVPVAGVGRITVSLELTLSGKIVLTYAGDFTTGFQYAPNDGFRLVSSFHKKTFSAIVEATAKLGVKLSGVVDLLVARGELYSSIGVTAKMNTNAWGDGLKPEVCTTIKGWMYMNAGAEAEISLAAWNKSFSRQLVIFDESNSPVYLSFHFEDGKQVAGCTHSIPQVKYTTPSDSRNGSTSYTSDENDSPDDGISSESSFSVFSFRPVEYIDSGKHVITYVDLSDEGNREAYEEGFFDVAVTGFSGNTAAATVPEYYGNHKVIAIESGCFSGNSCIQSVTVPKSVWYIGNAFQNCVNLRTVSVTSSVVCVTPGMLTGTASLNTLVVRGAGDNSPVAGEAFKNCTSLTKVTLDDRISYIGREAFSGCSNLKLASMTASITYVDSSAFDRCPDLEKIIIRKGIYSEVQSSAFEDCASLPSVEIAEGIVKIGYSAFRGCTGMKQVSIPSSVIEIGELAFSDCTGMERVVLSDGLVKLGASAFSCSGLKEIDLPGTINNLAGGEFESCDHLTEAIISEGITQLSESMFYNCVNLSSITLPESLQTIDSNCFTDCIKMEGILLPGGLKEIGNSAFSGCTMLASIEIPDSVTNVEWNAFRGCSSLSGLIIPCAVTTDDSFYGFYYKCCSDCNSLKNVTVRNSSPSVIGKEFFYGCASLETVTIEEGITGISEYAFTQCENLKTVLLPESLTSIKESAFQGCIRLASINLGGKLDTIENCAFYECESLKDVSLPDSLVTIDSQAFYNCIGLKEIILPSGLQRIGSNAFESCTGITTMELPLSLITLDDSAFYNCSGLKTLVIPSGLTDSFQSAFGGCENLADISIIKSTPRVISSGAFSGAPGLKKVSVEDGITVIEESAFYNCKALTEINLPDSVNRIGDNVFANCSRLESIQLPENISYLSAWIFSNCIALKEVTIPAAVKEIKEGAFENCTLLEELTIPAEVTSIGPNVFLYDYDLTLYGFVNTVAEQYASDYSIPFVAKDNRKDIADAEVTLDNARVVYDSGEKTPEITVSYGGTILTCNTDYTIEYRDNIQIGTGAVIVRGIGYYEGEKITTFTIYCEHQETVDPGYPASCSVEGMTDGTYCSICGEILRSKEVIPAGHTWREEAVYDTEPDCTSDGMMSIHCGVCNEVKEGTEVTIPALGHEFGDWEIETAAGCESAGMEVRICERCGISEYKEVSPTGHLWDDGTVTQEPEPGVEGIRTYTCTVCGEQIQKPVPALDVLHEHTYGEPEWIWTVDDGGWTVSAIFTCVDWDDSITVEADVSIDSYTQASCVQDGALVMVGSVVFHGEEYNNIHNEIIEKTGHDWETEYRVDREADCETEGIEAIHCSRCDATKAIRLISKADHVWDKGVVTKESSCTQSGEKKYTCKVNSSHTKTEMIPATGHTPSEPVMENVVPASCVSEGSCTEVVHCLTCNEEISRYTIVLEKSDHTSEIIPAVPATCTESGLTAGSKCAVCGVMLSEQQNLPPTGHNWGTGEVITAATCTQEGSLFYHCLNDDTHLKTETIPALGHEWDAGIITKNATCAETGIRTYTCIYDSSHTKTEEIPISPHILSEIDEKPADLESEGHIHYWSCKLCGKLFSDSDAKNEIDEKDIVVPRIQSYDVSAATISLSKSSFTYTGKEQRPAVSVSVGGKQLVQGSDYTVKYDNNINAGNAKVTIKGIANNTGTVSKSFVITKAAQRISLEVKAVSVAVGKTSTVSLSGAKGKKTFKSSNTEIATVNSKGVVTGKKVGTIKITAASGATTNYNAASKAVTIKVVPAATSSITAANQATGIKLTWKKVAGANGYLIYRGSTKIATINKGSTVTYTDKNANSNGTKFTYKIIAKAATGNSTLSKSLATYRVARPVISSVKNSTSRKMTIKWGKNAKSSGYQIQYSTSKTFASGNKTATVTSAATVSKVIGGLAKGKTYYVRMRTYKTVGKTKYYSMWSAARTGKITK